MCDESNVDPMTCPLVVGDRVEVVGPSVSGLTDRVGKKSAVHFVDRDGDVWVKFDPFYTAMVFPRASLRWLPPKPAKVAPAPEPQPAHVPGTRVGDALTEHTPVGTAVRAMSEVVTLETFQTDRWYGFSSNGKRHTIEKSAWDRFTVLSLPAPNSPETPDSSASATEEEWAVFPGAEYDVIINTDTRATARSAVDGNTFCHFHNASLARLAAAHRAEVERVRAEERERCAKVVDTGVNDWNHVDGRPSAQSIVLARLAAAIRDMK